MAAKKVPAARRPMGKIAGLFRCVSLVSSLFLLGSTISGIGSCISAFRCAAPEEQQAALAAFKELGAEYLKPVFDRLDGQVSYEDLRILRLRYLAR